MKTPDPQSIEFLRQDDVAQWLAVVGTEPWQTLYLHNDDESHRFTVWCALMDSSAAAKALEDEGWDLGMDDGRPGFSRSTKDGQEITTYHRFGSREGMRPLLHHREFGGAFPDYVEVDEEFRHYHNLAEDEKGHRLLSFDGSGREVEIARIQPKNVRVRLKQLRQFQAATGLHVAIFVDSVRYSKIALADVPESDRNLAFRDARSRWRRGIRKWDLDDKYPTFSRLLGKVILPPPPKQEAGVWPFERDREAEAKREVSFIVGIDADGMEQEFTSNPEALANFFGANPTAPNYLTPIFFRREVLAKYYAEPDRYSVEDGYLRCLRLWGCQIDNDLKSHVVVFLGDLGRDMPYEERLHWRTFNVPPEGGISKTNFRRSVMAQFADGEAADLTFRREYQRLRAAWRKAQGWDLFLPPEIGDSHLLETVRIPATNSQPEMDEQVGQLAKLLVDSLNERDLEKRVSALKEGSKGISKLHAFFEQTSFAHRAHAIQFLRDLQTLRSTGTAHRKGSSYDDAIARLGLDPADRREAVRQLLSGACAVLGEITESYCYAATTE